jgi:hypothetical protein
MTKAIKARAVLNALKEWRELYEKEGIGEHGKGRSLNCLWREHCLLFREIMIGTQWTGDYEITLSPTTIDGKYQQYIYSTSTGELTQNVPSHPS